MSKKFEYKYSAPTEKERIEIENIQKQYKQKDETENKLNELRKLDNKVKSTPAAISLVLGVVGTLIFGTGLTCILVWHLYLAGVVVSVVGSIPIALAYFVYNKLYNKLKNKYSNKILKLSAELLNEDNN